MPQPVQKLQHWLNDVRFKVTAYDARIDAGNTTVTNNGSHLNYITPFFRADATVECTTPANESFKVGFIQQCDSTSYKIEFPRAYTSWEIPSLPVSDACGNDFPWYQANAARVVVPGGSNKSLVNVTMNDNFAPNVGYIDPVLGDTATGLGTPTKFEKWLVKSGAFRDAVKSVLRQGGGDNLLQGLTRDQSFTTYLVARRDSDNKILVLKRTTWRLEVKIKVTWNVVNNPPIPTLTVKPVSTHTPFSMDGGPVNFINNSCLNAPTANSAQEFWWTPKTGTPGQRRRV